MASVDRRWIAPAIIIAAFAVSAIAFSRLPSSVALPVDALRPFAVPGETDLAPRWVLAFLIPSLALVLWVGFRFAVTDRGQHIGRWFVRNAPAEVTSAGQFGRFAKTYETINPGPGHVGPRHPCRCAHPWLCSLFTVGLLADGGVLLSCCGVTSGP